MKKTIWIVVLILCTTFTLLAAMLFALKGDAAGTVYMCFLAWWFRASLKERGED